MPGIKQWGGQGVQPHTMLKFMLAGNICVRYSTVTWKLTSALQSVEPSWNVIAHGNAWEGKWIEWVASTLHTTLEHSVSSITTADSHTSAASSWLNWPSPSRFKWTYPFRRKTKSGFCTCAIIFQTWSTHLQAIAGSCPPGSCSFGIYKEVHTQIHYCFSKMLSFSNDLLYELSPLS
jgi:hypothetical protein